MAETNEKCWLGTTMEDLCRGHGPWGFEVLPITASRHHAVLYQLPATLKSPPKPHYSSQIHHWDDDHVYMPFSLKNVFPVKNDNGGKSLKSRWELIQTALLQPINSSKELEAVISSYNTKLPKFMAMHHFFEEVLEEDESKQFFEMVLPGIIRLALQLPTILPGNLPLLKQGSCKSISLSQLQIASLLANAFLCTFPWRKNISATYPGVNFVKLFTAHSRPKREQAVAEKLKCICHYFQRVLVTEPVGVVTFERKHFPKSHLPRWDNCSNNLGNTRVHIASSGVIEEADGLLQVDFAHKSVGGGVLGFGCVQEEIRYVICPELIVSRLFTEQLGPTEALIMTGVERYSNYTGYGTNFEWSGSYQDKIPFDSFGRRRTSIVAIDALHFTKPAEQYNSSNTIRELNKAYVGFHSRFEGQLPPVATGNWGCGVYHGNPHLKFLIQLMACSAAKRDMVYYTFGDVKLRDDIHEIYLFLATNQVTVAQLWRYLCQFACANIKPGHLFSFIQQAHFDSKSQLCIKDFFCFNKKKIEKNCPSTSNTGHSSNNNNNNVDLDNNTPDEIDGNDSTSTYLELGNTESMNIESDPDIIESSQSEQKQKWLPRDAHKSKKNENLQKKQLEENKTDILQLIGAIDDSFKRSKTCNDSGVGGSLLSSIDDFAKTSTVGEENNLKFSKTSDSGKMHVDEVADAVEVCKKNSVFNVKDESVSKRKITDYFVKVDKG